MSTVAWVILLILGVPALALLAWLVLGASLIRVPTGAMGLVLVHGRASDTVLPPGLHLVPALRRRMLEVYPAVELTYLAGQTGTDGDDLVRTGPAIDLMLGDRTAARVACTTRFRLRAELLRDVHERYGPAGFIGIVRDQIVHTLARDLGDPAIRVEELFGSAHERREASLTKAMTEAMAPLGFEITFFSLGPVNLGRTGEVIQEISRARHELELEEANAAIRLARAGHDAELQNSAVDIDEAGWRYREADLWRDLAYRSGGLQLALRVPDPPSAGQPSSSTPPQSDGQSDSSAT